MSVHRDATAKQPQSATSGVVTATSNKQIASDVPARIAFVGMALTMAWQLAVVVLVPILGGHFLDRRFHTSPWLTLLGFVAAMGCMWLVLMRAVSAASAATKGGQQ